MQRSSRRSAITPIVGTFPAWGTVNLTGAYDLLPSQDNYTVIAPNGDAPTEAALLSHRYHHHTRVAVHGGRVWVAYSSSGTNEDAGGQMGILSSSPVQASLSFGSPIQAVVPQSAFTGAGASYVVGSRIVVPRNFVISGGVLYATFGIDNIEGGDSYTGLAIAAVECKSDGTIGTLFRITSQTYTPVATFPAINYDAVLGPVLYPSAKLFGIWGGSSPGNVASDWPSWIVQDGINFTHPCTIAIDGGARHIRLWRRVTSPDNYLWGQLSTDGGATFGTLLRTSIPDSPSSNAGIIMADGRLAMVGSPRDGGTQRDPLFLAIFEGVSKIRTKLYAVRQGISPTPTFAGTNKAGGAAYPGIFEDSGNLYVSYSMQKETIGLTRLPIANL